MDIPKPHFSNAIRAGDFIYISGQLPFGPDYTISGNDIAEQTSVCVLNITTALEELNASLTDVVKIMVWLSNPDDFAEYNTTYQDFFPGSPPARTTVGSTLMVPGALIEMDAVAYCPVSKLPGFNPDNDRT